MTGPGIITRRSRIAIGEPQLPTTPTLTVAPDDTEKPGQRAAHPCSRRVTGGRGCEGEACPSTHDPQIRGDVFSEEVPADAERVARLLNTERQAMHAHRYLRLTHGVAPRTASPLRLRHRAADTVVMPAPGAIRCL